MSSPEDRLAALEDRLAADEWLTPGQVAVLVGMSRWAVDQWLSDGIRIEGETARWFPEYLRTPGGRRLVSPWDVRRIVAMCRQRHHGRSAHGDSTIG